MQDRCAGSPDTVAGVSNAPQLRLSALTTLRVGGPASAYVVADTTEKLISAAAAAEDSLLLIGGGSNLLVSEDGWPGTVVRIANRGIAAEPNGQSVILDVAAGEPWDELVAYAVAQGLSGIECLAGIPGLTGATPIQNVGAYGAEIADVLVSVDVWDRTTGDVGVLSAAACQFAYRTSVFKHDDRFVVLGVELRLGTGGLSAPIRYAELARTLGVAVGERVPVAAARAAVLELRASKGMVLDAEDRDTWSAGSFFTNPILAPDRVPAGAPAWPTSDAALVKTSAAWLIEHAGFGKGYGSAVASLSSKHTLALTNRGGATADDLLSLAREIRDGVLARFGVELRPEPLLIGCEL